MKKISEIFNSIYTLLRNVKFDIFRNTYRHIIIVSISLLVVFVNIAYKNHTLAHNDMKINYFDINIASAQNVISDISKYTPFEEDVEKSEVAFTVLQNGDYLAKSDKIETEKSNLEREYIVQKGDSITTIANQFDLHVATILDRNNITVDEFENIKAGQIIIIPPKDTSNSKQWLADLNTKKQEEERQRQLALERKRREEEEKKRKLASRNRNVVNRERSTSIKSSGGYSGSFGGGFTVPISHNGISRGLSKGHAGIDYRASIGTPVRAAAAGKVVGITDGYGSGYGKSVLIDHGSGTTTRYAHLNSFASSVGESVGQGQVIGYSGNTGWSTGPHLHFETRVNGTAINPF